MKNPIICLFFLLFFFHTAHAHNSFQVLDSNKVNSKKFNRIYVRIAPIRLIYHQLKCDIYYRFSDYWAVGITQNWKFSNPFNSPKPNNYYGYKTGFALNLYTNPEQNKGFYVQFKFQYANITDYTKNTYQYVTSVVDPSNNTLYFHHTYINDTIVKFKSYGISTGLGFEKRFDENFYMKYDIGVQYLPNNSIPYQGDNDISSFKRWYLLGFGLPIYADFTIGFNI